MASFKAQLQPEEAQAVRAYLITRAHDAMKGQTPR
jgi:hypothetical protein